MEIKAVLFDMDGVIADTAKFHFIAWKETAQKIGIEIDEAFNEKLKGVDRVQSLQRILDSKGVDIPEQEKIQLMAEKNERYVELLQTLTEKDILPGILPFLCELRAAGIKISIASISQNAPFIIDKLGLSEFVDAIADPTKVTQSKPAPDIFIEAARLVGIPLGHCIGIEDAEAGIEAIKRANITSIGIGVSGDISLDSTRELNLSLLL